MPIFEYQCPKCGEEFEEVVLGNQETVTCPSCGSDKSAKLLSRCSFKSGGDTPVGSTGGSSGGSSCSGCSGGSCSTCG
ncbi:MAG: FmdB family zinc ribbon protein [Desulfovibrionales bacterium]